MSIIERALDKHDDSEGSRKKRDDNDAQPLRGDPVGVDPVALEDAAGIAADIRSDQDELNNVGHLPGDAGDAPAEIGPGAPVPSRVPVLDRPVTTIEEPRAPDPQDRGSPA